MMEHAAFSERLFIKEQYKCEKKENYEHCNFQWSSEDEKETIISTTHVITFLVIKETT